MLITTVEAFRALVATWDAGKKHGIDFETNGKAAWQPTGRLVGLSLAGFKQGTGSYEGCYIPLAHTRGPNAEPALMAEVAEYLEGKPLIPFWVHMEHPWALAKLGLRLKWVGDGYIAARLLQLPQQGLKDLCEAVLSRAPLRLEDLLPAGVYDFSMVDSSDPRVAEYGAADAVNAVQLENVLRTKVLSLGLAPSYDLELQAAVLMSEQSVVGYRVDGARLVEEIAEESRRMDRLAQTVFNFLGDRFLINSPKKIQQHLNRLGIQSPVKTKTGGESWSIDVLRMVAHRHPVIPVIIEWKEARSLVEGLRQTQFDPDEPNMVHPLWQSVGVSGSSRMRASKPDIVSLPKASRRAFPAPPGYQWVGLEWVQPEPRFLAALSGDPALLPLFFEGDFHAALAGVLGVPDRGWAKAFFYAYLKTGGHLKQIAERMQITEAGVRPVVQAFEEAFPKAKLFISQVRQRARNDGTLVSWLRRTRVLTAETEDELLAKAGVGVLQQSVGTALKVALSILQARMELGQATVQGLRQITPIFDRVYYCVPTEIPLAAHLATAVDIFTLSLLNDDTSPYLPLPVVASAGPSWGELEVVPPEMYHTAPLDEPPGMGDEVEAPEADHAD